MSTKNASIDFPTILKMLAGGATAGAGIGAVTTYLRHMKTLQENAAQSEAPKDDDVLYLNLPPKRQPGMVGKQAAAANSTGTFALGGLAGLLGTYMGYNGVRSMYQRARKKQLEKDLEQAQNVYVDRLDKSASQFSMPTKLVGGAGLGALLMALGSAAVTNKFLQKQFPPIEDPAKDRLRKIVIRSRGQEQAPMEVNSPSPAGDSDAVEQLMHNHLENKAAADKSGFADLVIAVSNGRGEEVRANLLAYGLDVMFDSVKGARFEKSSAVKNNLAITYLARDPLFSSACAPLLASEFYDYAPSFCKLADGIPQNCLEPLIGMAKCAAWRRREKLCEQMGWKREDTKEAAAKYPSVMRELMVDGALLQMFKSTEGGDGKGNQPPDTITNTSPSTDSTNKHKGVPLEVDDDQALNFARQNEKALNHIART